MTIALVKLTSQRERLAIWATWLVPLNKSK
jgi:hypothetical protein